MSQVLGVSGMTASNHIFQTYTYSWENHCCEGKSLQAAMLLTCPRVASNFDFNVFLQEYSGAVYEPLLVLLACAKEGRTDFTIKKFCSCVPKQINWADMAHNGLGLIKKIKENFNNAIPMALKEALNLDAIAARCTVLKIDATNAYLHTRGHDIYNLVRYIGWQLCKGEQVKFDKDILETNMSSDCWEMKALEDDLSLIRA